MYTTQITAVALTAFVALLQPCPAPLLPMILGPLGGGHKRSDITSNLDQCTKSFQEATESVRISGSKVTMEGVPAPCMAEAKAWNDHPHAGALAKDYGTVRVLNASAIEFDGLPQKTVDMIAGLIKQ